jgi:hypothetical protein
MPVLILGCGRTGTNMTLESLRASHLLKATTPAEDKTLFRCPRRLQDTYLSKCDTCYIDDLDQVSVVLDNNPELLILWTIRDIRDCAMSKIFRGQPGNDVGQLADDASFDGCIADIAWMSKIYRHITTHYSERIKLVKMENVILNYEVTMNDVCEFCNIPYVQEMKNFTSRYRGSVKQTKGKRYNGIDKSQVSLYKRATSVYDGFFKTHDLDLDLLFLDLDKDLELFGYE